MIPEFPTRQWRRRDLLQCRHQALALSFLDQVLEGLVFTPSSFPASWCAGRDVGNMSLKLRPSPRRAWF